MSRITFYAIKRIGLSQELFAGFMPSHRASAPRLKWDAGNDDEPCELVLYPTKDDRAIKDVEEFGQCRCVWIEVKVLR